jgi:hypothetical protein
MEPCFYCNTTVVNEQGQVHPGAIQAVYKPSGKSVYFCDDTCVSAQIGSEAKHGH